MIIVIAGFGLLAASASQAGLSIPAQIVRVVLLPLVPMPKVNDPEELQALVKENREAGPALPTDTFRTNFNVQVKEFNGQRLWTVAPHESTSQLHILYIPGSAYINEVLSLHWDIAEQLIERTDATLVMPFYPLAPENDYQPAYDMINAVYELIVQQAGAENVVIVGDSAGGGIALALAQQLRDQRRPLPAALVLFSPWLDVTVSDPSQPAIDQRDFILSIDTLRIGGKWWAGNLPTTDPRISPLYGSMGDLPPIAVFTGTDDLLYPDSIRLASKAEEAGVPFTLFEYRNEFHVWMGVFPQVIPEAARALDETAAFIREHTVSER
jgi:epsilon-lactone hydrolase